ncbi:MAG: hypothetical protein AB7W37_04685 [Syntrophobacteraceae bacterium]
MEDKNTVRTAAPEGEWAREQLEPFGERGVSPLSGKDATGGFRDDSSAPWRRENR